MRRNIMSVSFVALCLAKPVGAQATPKPVPGTATSATARAEEPKSRGAEEPKSR
jgi:hypothetical protein